MFAIFRILGFVIDLCGLRFVTRSKRKKFKRAVNRRLHTNKEETVTMSKSTFAAILAFLAAAVGALTAAALYLRRREKELDEYEQLLFSSDDYDEDDEDAADTEDAPAAETPAEPETTIEYADVPADKTDAKTEDTAK